MGWRARSDASSLGRHNDQMSIFIQRMYMMSVLDYIRVDSIADHPYTYPCTWTGPPTLETNSDQFGQSSSSNASSMVTIGKSRIISYSLGQVWW